MIDVDEKKFQFMLKEYEMLYSKFEMHYSAVEKTITVYFLIIGGMLSANSVLIKDWDNFSLFSLRDFQIFCCLFISIIGFVTTMKIIEHRLLIITYVKNLNLNRKWFFDSYGENELQAYSIFEATGETPKYYKPFRHFYWEILGIATVNSAFLSVFIINLVAMFKFQSVYCVLINWAWFALITLIETAIILVIYKKRGDKEEAKLKAKGLGKPVIK